MDNNTTKFLGWVFVVVIAVLAFLWYRGDQGRLKWIQELKNQISAYEEKIDELTRENKSMEEELAWYYKQEEKRN